MKILIISNLYPPYYLGGYELRCALIAEGLVRAGHEVRVLTSRYGLPSTAASEEEIAGVRVYRSLGEYVLGVQEPVRWPYFLHVVRPQLRDTKNFVRILDEFQPDVVNWWSVRGLTKAILSIPKLRGLPDLLCVEDDWVVQEELRGPLHERPPWSCLWGQEGKPWYWQPVLVWLMKLWRTRLLQLGIVTSTAPFRPTHVCFVSEFLRDDFRAAGIEYSSTSVIYGGVRTDKFCFSREKTISDQDPLRLLYVGQITRDRGLHTAIEALSLLAPEERHLTRLTVVGDGFEPTYPQQMRFKVRDLGLAENISFVGKKSYDEMPEIYRRHDLLISPSLRKEGLPLTMMEAMLSGCAVITTGSGGAIEIARSADLPLFPKGDASALSQLLENLIHNRQQVEQIGRRGQSVALREFSSDQMISRFVTMFDKIALEKGKVSS